MKTSKLASTTAALALVALLGTAGIASSAPAEVPAPPVAGQMGPHMGPHMNLTPEQMNALQDIHKEFGPKMQPLFQQKYGKQAEINALLYQGVKPDDPRIVALQKDVKDVDGKLYQLDGAMRKQMQDSADVQNSNERQAALRRTLNEAEAKLSGGEELGWQIKTVWGVGYKFEVRQ